MSYTSRVARMSDEDLIQQLRDAGSHVYDLTIEADKCTGERRRRVLESRAHAEDMRCTLLAEYQRRGLHEREPA